MLRIGRRIALLAIPALLLLSAGLANPAAAASAATPSVTPPGAVCGSNCSMGVVDYGVAPNGTAYQYAAASFEGFAKITKLTMAKLSNRASCPPKVDPYATTCMSLQENLGAFGLMDENNNGSYWPQNIVNVGFDGKVCSLPCVRGTYSVSFGDNLRNESSKARDLDPGSMAVNQSGACRQAAFASLGSKGGLFYYCVGPVIYNLTLPISLWAVMTVGPNMNSYYTCARAHDSCLAFYGAVKEGSTVRYSGYFDRILFTPGSAGAGHPEIEVGTHWPGGGHVDAEWVLAGPCCFEVTNVTSLRATLGLYYDTGAGSNATYPGQWLAVPHAWSSGSATGEHVESVDVSAISATVRQAFARHGNEDSQSSLW